MPLGLYAHRLTCTTRRRPCDCNPEAFPLDQAEEALKACNGDHRYLELGAWTPPVHVDVIEVPRSQSERHKRQISN